MGWLTAELIHNTPPCELGTDIDSRLDAMAEYLTEEIFACLPSVVGQRNPVFSHIHNWIALMMEYCMPPTHLALIISAIQKNIWGVYFRNSLNSQERDSVEGATKILMDTIRSYVQRLCKHTDTAFWLQTAQSFIRINNFQTASAISVGLEDDDLSYQLEEAQRNFSLLKEGCYPTSVNYFIFGGGCSEEITTYEHKIQDWMYHNHKERLWRRVPHHPVTQKYWNDWGENGVFRGDYKTQSAGTKVNRQYPEPIIQKNIEESSFLSLDSLCETERRLTRIDMGASLASQGSLPTTTRSPRRFLGKFASRVIIRIRERHRVSSSDWLVVLPH